MERIAVFADVHSDFAALKSILEAAEEAGCSGLWCLGDFLGSGGRYPVECYDLVLARCGVVLAGNHERFISPVSGPPIFLTLAGGWADHAYSAAMALGPARRARLSKLPSRVFLAPVGAELVHGSLTDTVFGFVATAEDAASTFQLAEADASLVLCGHTHRAAFFEARTDGLTGELAAVEHTINLDVEYDLPVSGACLNPGAGCDSSGARWLELRFDGERRKAVWHQTEVRGHGRKLPE